MKRNLIIGFRRSRGFILLCLLVLFCLSCQKEDRPANLQQVTDEDITMHDGRLVFKDVATFMDHQKWLSVNQDNPRLIAGKNKDLGMKSMTEYFLEGMKLDESDPGFVDYITKYPSVFNKELYDNSTMYVLPHSIILCYVANKDGIFQIGDQIYRIVPNYIYRTGDESMIEKLLLPKDQIPVKEIAISVTRPGFDSKSDLAQRTEYFGNNSKFRIVSSVMEYSITDPYLGTGWWYDIRTNPQKKTLGIWFGAQLNTKSANGNGYWFFPDDGVQHLLYPDYEETTGATQHNILVCGGSPIDLNTSFCPAFSRGRLIDGTVEYLYIQWNNALSNSPTFTTRRTSYLSDPY